MPSVVWRSIRISGQRSKRPTFETMGRLRGTETGRSSTLHSLRRGTVIDELLLLAKDDRNQLLAELKSSVSRDAAHAFYKAIGYSVFATSHLFRKSFAESVVTGDGRTPDFFSPAARVARMNTF